MSAALAAEGSVAMLCQQSEPSSSLRRLLIYRSSKKDSYFGGLVGAPLESPVVVFGFPSTLRTVFPVAFFVEW
jgi:hypothetical protein